MRKIYFIFADKFRISPRETDEIEFYMVEYLLKDLEEKIEEENKRNRKQEADYKKQSSDYKMPKVGDTNYGGFKTPKLSVPSMNMPRI